MLARLTDMLFCVVPAILVVTAIVLAFPALCLWVVGLVASAAFVYLLTGGEKL